MRIGKRTGGFLLILFFVISMQGKDIGLELVCNGSPNAVIILGEKPTRAAQMGVYELRHHIQLITGVTLPIRRVKADAAVKIYIGDSSAARSAGLKPELCSCETYQLKTVGNNIYLIGCDSPDYGTVDYSRYETFPKNYFATCGSLHAVYDFLEHQCGVLFCGPWENSTAFQKQKNLSISPVNKKFTPPLDAFRGLYTDDSNYTILLFNERERSLWQLRWRMSEFTERPRIIITPCIFSTGIEQKHRNWLGNSK